KAAQSLPGSAMAAVEKHRDWLCLLQVAAAHAKTATSGLAARIAALSYLFAAGQLWPFCHTDKMPWRLPLPHGVPPPVPPGVVLMGILRACFCATASGGFGSVIVSTPSLNCADTCSASTW